MRTLRTIAAGVWAAGWLLAGGPAGAQEGQGITRPVVLPPFDASASACTAPPTLSRTLGFAKDNDRDFIIGVGAGLAAAAEDRGLAYSESSAANDATAQAAAVDGYVRQNIGAVVTAPVDAFDLGPHLQQVIWSGGYVGAVVPPPATTILNAPQYLTGKTLADEAADYVRENSAGAPMWCC